MKFEKKYFYDDDYFLNIDTEHKAYWLGFLYADGHVDNNTCALWLQARDKEHLKKFLLDINAASVPLHYDKIYNEYGITLHSKVFINNLQNLGFTSRKTYDNTAIVFQNVPDSLKKDFLRGYWDGDGCIGSYSKQRNYTEVVSLNKKLLMNFVNYFNFIFNDPYFSQLYENHTTKNIYYRIKFGSIKAYKVCEFLYKNSTIYLDRKHKKFLELVPSRKNYINIRQTSSGKFQAYIKVNYKQENLGTYMTIKEAINAYNKRAIELDRNPQQYVGENLFNENNTSDVFT